MENKNIIEEYLLEMNLNYENVKENIWVVDEIDASNKLVIYVNDDIVVFRIKVMDVPENNQAELFKKLLELNAYDLVHGAYALEDNTIVIVDTLQLENLDKNEFMASIESIDLSLEQHKEILKGYL